MAALFENVYDVLHEIARECVNRGGVAVIRSGGRRAT